MADNRRSLLAWLSLALLPILLGIAYALTTYSHPAVNVSFGVALQVGVTIGITLTLPGVVGTLLAYTLFGKRAWPRIAKMLLTALTIGLILTLVLINGVARMNAGTWLAADWSAFPRMLIFTSAAYLPTCIIFWSLAPQRSRDAANPPTPAP